MRENAALALIDPPPMLKQRLRRLIRAGGSPLEASLDLVADSRTVYPDSGVGGPATGELTRYQLMYHCAQLDLVLDVAEIDAETIDLSGQVLARPGLLPVFEATVHWQGGMRRGRLDDDLGGFALLGVPLTASLLTVTNDDVVASASLDLCRRRP
jgi:hypothetical protein